MSGCNRLALLLYVGLLAVLLLGGQGRALAMSDAFAMRPYHEQDYALAYQVFVSAGQLDDAWRVAHSAVRQRPNDASWRERLAQVSEWSGRVQLAYDNWRWLSQRQPDHIPAREAVLRLGPGLGDQQAVLSAWLLRHQGADLADSQIQEVMSLFESTHGSERGADWFRQRHARGGKAVYLAAAARLLERAGQDEQARVVYQQLLTSGASVRPGWVLSAVILELRQGRREAAMALLQQHASAMPADATEYWRVMGDLAWQLQQDQAVISAYRKLAGSAAFGQMEAFRLLSLLERLHPEQASDFALMLFDQQADTTYLLRALSGLAARQDWMQFGRVLERLDAGIVRQLERQAGFLVLRAQFHARQGRHQQADADIAAAYANRQEDTDILAQVLWHYIDQRNIDKLRELLARHLPQARKNSALWSPFAAGYHQLDDIRPALGFYQLHAQANPDDVLWLLNYADALERGQQTGMADRIRRHAMTKLRQRGGQQPLPVPVSGSPTLLAYANLVLRDQKGDGANRYMRSVVARLKGLASDVQDDQQTKDLILAWAINQDSIPAARLWLLSRYGRMLNSRAPLWGQSSVALRTSDGQTLARLMENPDALPPYDRHDVAQQLERWGQSAQIAFDNQRGNPADSAMHERYVASYLRQANLAGLQFDLAQGDRLRSSGVLAFAELKLTPHWRVGLEWSQMDVERAAGSFYASTPTQTRLLGLSLSHVRENFQLSGAVRGHHGITDWVSGEVSAVYRLSSRTSLSASARYAAPNRDTTPMRLAGMEDVIQASLTHAVTLREYVRISASLAQYRTQTDSYLGTGAHVDWEVGHRFRTAYPDWNVRFAGAHRRYFRDGAADAASMLVFRDEGLRQVAGYRQSAEAFLPVDNDYYALCTGVGQLYAERRNLDGTTNPGRLYTKAWRPLGEVCATYNSAAGRGGYSVLAGLRGSLDGEDQVLIAYQESNAGLQLPNQTVQALTVKYERLF